MRSRRAKWCVPSRVEERVRQLQVSLQRRSEVAEQSRHANDVTTETLAQDWLSRGEAHRALIYEITNAALRRLGNQPPPLEAWADIERADKAGRRACGLDDSEAVRSINVGMQLIEYRLAHIQLPPDAPEALKAPGGDASGIAGSRSSPAGDAPLPHRVSSFPRREEIHLHQNRR